MPKRMVMMAGLMMLGAVTLVALVWLTPATRADLFDSPISTPYAYLPFVAARASIAPPAQFRVYLPVVVRDGVVTRPAR